MCFGSSSQGGKCTICTVIQFVLTLYTIVHRNTPLVSGRWDTEGCVRNDRLSNSTHTVCECTHLTNFAILLSAKPISDPVHSFALGVIGYIGVSLSVLAMLCTIAALVFLR